MEKSKWAEVIEKSWDAIIEAMANADREAMLHGGSGIDLCVREDGTTYTQHADMLTTRASIGKTHITLPSFKSSPDVLRSYLDGEDLRAMIAEHLKPGETIPDTDAWGDPLEDDRLLDWCREEAPYVIDALTAAAIQWAIDEARLQGAYTDKLSEVLQDLEERTRCG